MLREDPAIIIIRPACQHIGTPYNSAIDRLDCSRCGTNRDSVEVIEF